MYQNLIHVSDSDTTTLDLILFGTGTKIVWIPSADLVFFVRGFFCIYLQELLYHTFVLSPTETGQQRLVSIKKHLHLLPSSSLPPPAVVRVGVSCRHPVASAVAVATATV